MAVVLSLTGLLAVRLADLREGYDPVVGVPADSLPGVWARWDSSYYVSIARWGYERNLHALGYFPLYPLAMSVVSQLTGLDLVASGMLVSQLSYLGAILGLYKLAHWLKGDRAYAMRSVLYLALFPTSFFYLAVYAEAMTLLLSIVAAYLSVRGRWVLAGLAIGLASLSRPVGWLLNLVLLVEFISRRSFSRRSLLLLAAGLALSACGVVSYALYVYSFTGSLLAVTEAQSAWLREWELPWVTLCRSIRFCVWGSGVPGDWFLYVANLYDLLFAAVSIVLAVASFRRIRTSLTVFLVFSIAFVLSIRGVDPVPLWGFARWVAPLFPLYLTLADVGQSRSTRRLGWAGSAAGLLLFSSWWATGRWVG